MPQRAVVVAEACHVESLSSGAVDVVHAFRFVGPCCVGCQPRRHWADCAEVALVVDFLPHRTEAELEQQVRHLAAEEGKRAIAGVFGEELPRRLVDALLVRAQIPNDRRAAEFPTNERGRLIAQIKRCEVRVTGSRGFEKAEVTAGGVSLDEVDSRTMESKLVPGLYLAGEILDLDGFIGGYNFQAAFSTGWLAGESV